MSSDAALNYRHTHVEWLCSLHSNHRLNTMLNHVISMPRTLTLVATGKYSKRTVANDGGSTGFVSFFSVKAMDLSSGLESVPPLHTLEEGENLCGGFYRILFASSECAKLRK